MRKEEIIDLHYGFFHDFGFELHPQNLWFQKSFPEGNQVVFVHYSEYTDLSYLEYNLGVRIHPVEQIIHKFLPSLSDYSNRSITLIQTLDSISPQFPRRFSINENHDLTEAMMSAEEFFIQKGFRWMDQMILPQNLEKAFASQKEKPFRTQNFVYTAFRGVTLARLYCEEDYVTLRKYYLEQIEKKDMTPFTIASFLRLLDFLDHLEVNSSFSHL